MMNNNESWESSLPNIQERSQERCSSEQKYLVDGAVLRCEYGDKLNQLLVPNGYAHSIGERPVATKKDNVVFENIWDFGICKQQTLLARERTRLFTITVPCIPEIISQWRNTFSISVVTVPVLTEDSFLVCACGGGVIEPITNGQSDLPGTFISAVPEDDRFVWISNQYNRHLFDYLSRYNLEYESERNGAHQFKSAERNGEYYTATIHMSTKTKQEWEEGYEKRSSIVGPVRDTLGPIVENRTASDNIQHPYGKAAAVALENAYTIVDGTIDHILPNGITARERYIRKHTNGKDKDEKITIVSHVTINRVKKTGGYPQPYRSHTIFTEDFY